MRSACKGSVLGSEVMTQGRVGPLAELGGRPRPLKLVAVVEGAEETEKRRVSKLFSLRMKVVWGC